MAAHYKGNLTEPLQLNFPWKYLGGTGSFIKQMVSTFTN